MGAVGRATEPPRARGCCPRKATLRLPASRACWSCLASSALRLFLSLLCLPQSFWFLMVPLTGIGGAGPYVILWVRSLESFPLLCV